MGVLSPAVRALTLPRGSVAPWLVGFASAAILVARQPWQLDGRLFSEEIALAAVPYPVWHGFIHVLPWLAIRAGLGFLAFVAVVGLVSAFVASDRLDLGPGPALLVALVPFSSSALATILDAHFILGLYLALLAVAKPSRWDVPTAAFAALNGPAAAFLVPFYLRKPRPLMLAVCIPAALQVVTFVVYGRPVIA